MLLRQTVLYLPAQLLPAAMQFVALVLWSHLATPSVIGIVTLFVSIQDFMVLGFVNFWTSYTVRYATKEFETPAAAAAFDRTATAVMIGSSLLQAAVAVALYAALIDLHPRPWLLPILVLVVFGRAFNTFQAERGRAQGDILLYSIETIAGPVGGALIGVALLWRFGSDELWIFVGYAGAQTLAAAAGLLRDRSWVRWGRPDGAVIRHALGYGGPLIVSSLFIWITQNTPRVLVSAFFGLAAAGVYALGFGLGFRVAVIAAMSVTAAAFPIAVRYANKGDMAGAMRQLANNAVLLVAVLAASIAGLALVSGDVTGLFVKASLQEAARPIMLWSLLAGAIICFRQHFLHQVFLVKEHTRPLGYVAAAEAVAAVLIGLLIVPRWGALGGVISLTVTSTGSMAAVLVMAMGQGLRPPWRDFARIALATGAMALAILAIQGGHSVPLLVARIAAGGAAFVGVMALLYGRALAGMWRARRVAPVPELVEEAGP